MKLSSFTPSLPPSFLFSFLSWDPYNSNVGVFNVVPEVSETVLNSFHSFFFILLPGSYFHPFIFQLTYPFFCLSYSVIDSFSSIFISVIVLFITVCLLFSSSRSSLSVSCIFSILFSAILDHLYYHYSELFFR